MGQQRVESPIGFADAEFVAYRRKGDALTVEVEAWNAKSVRIDFRDVLYVADLGVGDISDFVVMDAEDDEWVAVAMAYHHELASDDDVEYRTFAFLDTDDEPSLMVVAGAVDVVVVEQG